MGAIINSVSLHCSYNSITKNVTISGHWDGEIYHEGAPCFNWNNWYQYIYLGVTEGCDAINCTYFPDTSNNIGIWGFGGAGWQYINSSGVTQPISVVIGGADFNANYRNKEIYFYCRDFDSTDGGNKSKWAISYAENCIPSPSLPGCYCDGGVLSQPPMFWSGTLPPLAPSVPTFTLANIFYIGIDSVEVDITSNTTDVDYWMIQRSNTSGGTYTTIGYVYPSTGHTYYDTTVITGNTYWYKVIAVNELYGTPSAVQSIFVQSTIPSYCVAYNEITLGTITGDTNNATYSLLRSATSGGTYTQVAVSTGLTLIDRTPVYGTTYWYKPRIVGSGWGSTGTTPTQLATVITLSGTPVLSGTGTTVAYLTWTDSNVYQQNYEIYHDQGAGYSLILTTENQYATITGLTIGLLHNFKIRAMIDCFDPTFIYSSYSNVVQVSVYPELNPPSGETATSITCTGATIGWVNNNTGDTLGNYVKVLSGATWIIIDTIASGDTSYVLTGLIPFTGYSYSICAFNSGGTYCGGLIGFMTLDPAPFNLSASTLHDSATINWQINDPPYGTAIRPEYRYSGTTNYTTKPLIAKNATTYTFTGLSYNTAYEARMVRIGTEYPSLPIGFITPDYEAPTDLSISSIGDNAICLQWINHGTSSDDIDVYVRESGYTWQIFANVPSGTTSICVTGLSMLTEYTFVIANNYGSSVLYSNQVVGTTTVSFAPPFCSGTYYDVTGSTCGNSTGIIAVDKDYLLFYTFILTDIWGNIYTQTAEYWTGLTGGWYQITATPFNKYKFHYGPNSCTVNWIPLPDTDTTIILNDVKIKNAICGGFGGSKGRIIYQFSDSGGTSWTFTLWNADEVKVNTQSLTGITNIQYNSPADIYYGILENNNGCTYLIGPTFVDAERLYTVAGIQRLFITPWSATTEYNYYDSSSDDWYVAGIDQQQFTSTKIKEYLNVPDFWYEIVLNTAVMSYSDTLQKDQNGLTYNEVVTITIPRQDNAKWKQLVNILTQRYIVVFQDNHDQWWTCFYRNGAEVKSYSINGNTYVITLQHPSVSKMLTAIDYTYVKNSIL